MSLIQTTIFCKITVKKIEPLGLCNLSYGGIILSIFDKSFFDLLFDRSTAFDQLHFNEVSMGASPITSFHPRALHH